MLRGFRGGASGLGGCCGGFCSSCGGFHRLGGGGGGFRRQRCGCVSLRAATGLSGCRRFCRLIPGLQFHRFLPQPLKQGIVNALAVPKPADHRSFCRAAVIGHRAIYRIIAHQSRTQIHILRLIALGWDHHRLHRIDLPKLLLGIFQLQLQFLHIQPFSLQRKIRQGGIKGHQHIALLYLVTGLHKHLRDRLGGRQVYRLHPVCGDGAIGFLGIAPVLRHADHGKVIHIHRFAAPAAQKPPAAKACTGSQRHRKDDGNDFFRPLILHRCRLLPVYPSGVLRPECGRSCPRRQQCPVRG